MNRSSLAVIIFSFLILGVGLALFAYYGLYLVEYHDVKVDFRVEHGIVGLDADADALHFGTVAPGGTSVRMMTVTPAHDARLVIAFAGDAAPYLSVNTNNIEVFESEPVKINFTISLPKNMTDGNYTGKAKLYFYKS